MAYGVGRKVISYVHIGYSTDEGALSIQNHVADSSTVMHGNKAVGSHPGSRNLLSQNVTK